MGNLIMILSAITGAFSSSKSFFVRLWIVLINLSVSIFAAVFAVEGVVKFMESMKLPFFQDKGLQFATLILGLTFIFMIALMKIAGQIMPDKIDGIEFPAIIEKPGKYILGALIGFEAASVALFAFSLTDFANKLPGNGREQLFEQSAAALKRHTNFVSVFSFQNSDSRFIDIVCKNVAAPPKKKTGDKAKHAKGAKGGKAARSSKKNSK